MTTETRRPRVGRGPVRSALKHLALIATAALMLYPVIWMVVSSLRPTCCWTTGT